MRPSPSHVVALALLLLGAGCVLDPVDFAGKSCNSDLDCPDGLTCGRSSRKCEPTGGSDASPAQPDAGPDASVAASDAEVAEPDADGVEPPDAEAPGRDTGAPRDASTRDTGAAEPDAAAPAGDGGNPDVGLLSPDAASPGPDAAQPGPDAGACGSVTQAPLLQRVGPSAVFAGSTDLTLSLGGASFDPCAEVRVNGQAVTAQWLSAGELSATVPASMLADPAVLPVQVVNPSGLASNPNLVQLASKVFSDNAEPIGVAVLDTGALAVANYGSKSIAVFDGETLAGPTKSFSTNNQPEDLAYGGGKLWYPNNNRLMVVSNPLGNQTTTTLNLAYDFQAFDVDDAYGTLLVAEANNRYQTVDLVTQAVAGAVQVTGSWIGGFQAAGLDMARGLAVLPSQTGSTYVVPVGSATPSYTANSTSGYGAAVDRGAGIAYLGGSTSVRRVDLSGSTPASITVPLTMRVLRHNPLSRRIVATPAGETSQAYSVALVDAEAGALAGYLGAGARRGCGPNTAYRVEGLAIDPQHNRAYVTASCDDSLEAYNLNVLMVTLPAPTIASFTPATHAASSAPFSLTITGTNFHPSATVSWGTTALVPTSVTPTEMVVTAPATTCGGSKTVTVTNTDPARWSANKPYSVTMGTPTLISANLGGCACTDGACTTCTVSVTGIGFTSGCSVVHVGTASGTGTGNTGSLTASVSLCAGATGSATACGQQVLGVNVSNPGGGTSGTANVTY